MHRYKFLVANIALDFLAVLRFHVVLQFLVAGEFFDAQRARNVFLAMDLQVLVKHLAGTEGFRALVAGEFFLCGFYVVFVLMLIVRFQIWEDNAAYITVIF